MVNEIKDPKKVSQETEDEIEVSEGVAEEKEEIWGAVPLEEKLEGSSAEASQVSQEEADALIKGLEDLDMLTDSIPDIPNLEEQAKEAPQEAAGVSSMSAIDDIIASVQGTSFDMGPGPAASSPGVSETRPASFPSLDPGIGGFSGGAESSSLDLLMDIPVQLSVVLGRARKTIGEVLALEPGAIVELDKLAGESVEVLANGKLILKGEVVVIDESFGIRVTELVSKS